MKKGIISIAVSLFFVLTAFADNLSVADVTIASGETGTISICLNNTSDNLVSFQMDLTLPEGITINKANCSLSSRFTDDEQELTIGKQGENTYRLTSTSFSLTPINGTSGELLTLSVTAAESFYFGTATITNVRFATSNSERVETEDVSFSITKEIVATDISQMDNAIYIEPFDAHVGEDVEINVSLKNAETASAYNFELVLPEGISINVTEENDFDDEVTLSSRNSKHQAITNKVSDNVYRLAVASLSSKNITGNDGVVLTILAHVSETMPAGIYPVQINSPLLVKADGTKPDISATLTTVNVEDYIKGDVDGDGVVDLADAVVIINYCVGKPVNTFVAKAADADGDGVIDLADAVRIINYCVGKIETLAREMLVTEIDPE